MAVVLRTGVSVLQQEVHMSDRTACAADVDDIARFLIDAASRGGMNGPRHFPPPWTVEETDGCFTV